ncbi:MAG: DUF302 domain-containing protein [Litoreibacter sp.]|nr:DUF302 domain-containing protein [Litoreibacter sp.]
MKTYLASLFVAVGLTAPASAELITVKSDKSVPEVMDALEAAVTGAGATVFARIDHRAGAQSAGLEMDFAETLIFGNPKLGTPAMNADIRAALMLPMKVAAYADPDGGVFLTYEDPAAMFEGLDIPADAKFVQMMTGALGKLTAKAAE